MPDNLRALLTPGTEISFQDGDCENVKGEFKFRVMDHARDYGMTDLHGYFINEYGWPAGRQVTVRASDATIRQRLIHRNHTVPYKFPIDHSWER